METTISFGYWIRRQRKALDLTQQILADRVGYSLAAIKRLKRMNVVRHVKLPSDLQMCWVYQRINA